MKNNKKLLNNIWPNSRKKAVIKLGIWLLFILFILILIIFIFPKEDQKIKKEISYSEKTHNLINKQEYILGFNLLGVN